MLTTFKHLVFSGLGGAVFAGLVGLCWRLGTISLGVSPGDEPQAVCLALGAGALSAALVGTCFSFLSRRTTRRLLEQLAAMKTDRQNHLVEARAARKSLREKRQRRRHPLVRASLRARLSAALRWQGVSKSLQHLLHVPAKELIGKSILEMLHPEDVPALDRMLTDARTTRQVCQVLLRFVTADSTSAVKTKKLVSHADTDVLPVLNPRETLHIRLSVWARLDQSGTVRHYDCRCIDLTEEMLHARRERHTARSAMSTAKKRLRSLARDLARLKLSYHELYHNAPVMYFSVNPDGKLVTFNETLLRTLGYERRELHGRSYNDLLASMSVKSQGAVVQTMPGQEGDIETQWRKKDGVSINVWIHTVPVTDERGRFARYRSAALDLSEKNRLANELRARGDELERMNQRLRLINTELEDFTHVVSHDLKEPLRTLQAYSHILAEEHAAQLGPDGFQYINHLIRASRRLGILIDELLHLSQAGRITRAPEAFNLIEIVATVRQDLVDLIQRKDSTLIAEGSLPDLIGDPVRITQLLTNLVTNGLKYNQMPAPQVVIGALPCPDDSSQVTIFVRDNGIGIDPAFHQQIFGIFRRLHQADEYEGTGAGLAICKKIVVGHGGRIWVESQLGHGATFFFTLPRAPADKGAKKRGGARTRATDRIGSGTPSSAARLSALPADGVNGARPAQIVLVEDQPEVAMIIQKLGKRDGLAITWFPTAEEAWDYLQKARADLLLLDVNLPGISGVELCQRLRTLDHLKQTPVAMFTPEQEPEQLQNLQAAGADFFLTKDLLCQPALWQQKIQDLLEQIRLPLAH